jgi:hypothetical protein
MANPTEAQLNAEALAFVSLPYPPATDPYTIPELPGGGVPKSTEELEAAVMRHVNRSRRQLAELRQMQAACN